MKSIFRRHQDRPWSCLTPACTPRLAGGPRRIHSRVAKDRAAGTIATGQDSSSPSLSRSYAFMPAQGSSGEGLLDWKNAAGWVAASARRGLAVQGVEALDELRAVELEQAAPCAGPTPAKRNRSRNRLFSRELHAFIVRAVVGMASVGPRRGLPQYVESIPRWTHILEMEPLRRPPD